MRVAPGKTLPERYSIKRLSNDLARLYKMSFLKRRRVKRQVTTNSGKVCNRGYCYEYQISKQGFSYLSYLRSPVTPRKPTDDDLAKKVLQFQYRDDSRKDAILAAYDLVFPPQPPSQAEKFYHQGKNRSQLTLEGKKTVEELQKTANADDLRAEMLRALEKYKSISQT
jgi:hypothetical protein